MKEAIIQDAFAMWLRKNHIAFVQARRDQKSTIKKGWPDFSLIHCGRSLLIETKTVKGKLSEDQKTVFAEILKHSGMVVHVCRSVEECVARAEEWLGTRAKLAGEAPALGNGPSTSTPKATEEAGEVLANWSGTASVFKRVGERYMFVRKATDDDMRTLPVMGAYQKRAE